MPSRTRLQPFRHRDVKLTAGPLKQQFDSAFDFYMKLENDRLLKAYRQITGLQRVRTVMDPFLGLGSTAVAAARLKVGFVGIELDEHYLKEAVERTRVEIR